VTNDLLRITASGSIGTVSSNPCNTGPRLFVISHTIRERIISKFIISVWDQSWHGADGLSLTSRVCPAADSAQAIDASQFAQHTATEEPLSQLSAPYTCLECRENKPFSGQQH